jgi:hypothetical protein
MAQLQQNLTAGVARAVISTAINGGSLEDALRDGIKGAILDTVAAQTANAIGDLTGPDKLNTFTNALAHAIAGCAVGAARTESSGGCAAGALGAAVGELAAQAYGKQPDTVQFAAMMSGIAVAIAGGDANQINLGSQAGANAAANNYLNHQQEIAFQNALKGCNKDTKCIEDTVSKWQTFEREQSANVDSCDSSKICTSYSHDARDSRGFTNNEINEMCGGVAVCISFASDLPRLNVIDEINGRQNGHSVALARAVQQLIDLGISPETASVAAGLTPADLAGVALGVGGAIRGVLSPSLSANGVVVPRIVSGTLPAAEEAVVKATMDHIIAGTTPSGNLSIRWGIPFENRAGDLPGGQYASSPYKEYRVAPLPGQAGPGPNRLVVNSITGEMYYTWNHYGDRNAKPPFVQVR